MVVKNAFDTIFITKDSIQNNPFVYILDDTGNKKGNKNLVKYLCWYYLKDPRVKTYMLDVDFSNKKSEDVAIAIKHGLLQVFGTVDGVTIIIYGQCTDSGGGGTGRSLF